MKPLQFPILYICGHIRLTRYHCWHINSSACALFNSVVHFHCLAKTNWLCFTKLDWRKGKEKQQKWGRKPDSSSLSVKISGRVAQTKEDHATLSYLVILPLFLKRLVVLTLLELLGTTEVNHSLSNSHCSFVSSCSDGQLTKILK